MPTSYYLQGDGPPIERYNAISDYFDGKGTVLRETITSFAKDEGLPDDWLNDALSTVFFSSPLSTQWVEYPGLRVYIAPTDYLLTMKIAACGSPQDIEDARTLAQQLHITNTQEMFATIMRYIPEALITSEMNLLVEQIVETVI